ncbi:MAG: methyltransferase [Alphaproteobacteria bacterium]|nr:methyltransferase [Alphaproteobacteria bacterium]
MPDAHTFITANLRLEPAPGLPEIRLYRAHSGSRLRRLTGDSAPPYWAYQWAGGAVLARHILKNPNVVQGRRVLDLGTGSGVVAIAAALSGAASVRAADIDPFAIAAATLNAEANGVQVETIESDPLADPPPDCDLILAGDMFYEAGLAHRVCASLDSWGVETLVGDMGRKPLPRDRLEPLAQYDVGDFGHPGLLPATVYRYKPGAPVE